LQSIGSFPAGLGAPDGRQLQDEPGTRGRQGGTGVRVSVRGRPLE
jgi:hypothetical protein